MQPSENPVRAKFTEIPIPRIPVHKGMGEDQGGCAGQPRSWHGLAVARRS
jgi:hypothetical protein